MVVFEDGSEACDQGLAGVCYLLLRKGFEGFVGLSRGLIRSLQGVVGLHWVVQNFFNLRPYASSTAFLVKKLEVHRFTGL